MIFEWQKIKREIHYFLAALISSVILLGVSLYYHQGHQAEWQNNKRKLTQAKMNYLQAKDRKKLIEQYEKTFILLRDNGVFGEEQRIQWIETIQRSTEDRQIPSVKFDINQRIKLNKKDLNRDLGGVDIRLSKMRLDFELLHEGDLFALFRDLDSEAHGLNMVSGCSIKNNIGDAAVLDSRSRSNFVGFCDLLWITFSEQEREDD